MNLLADTVVDKASNSSSFGCCHRYRQCSDAKRCLLAIEDEQRTKQCTYRYNLEQGLIFYGKNANGFSMKRYNDFRMIYDSSYVALQHTLDALILYLAGGAYLSSNVLWFYSPEVDNLQTLGVIKYQRLHKFTLENYSMKELKDATGSKLIKKEELINFIIASKPDVLSLLSEPYCYVQIPKENRQYVLELYYDLFYETKNNRYTGPLPFPKKVTPNPEKENPNAKDKR